MSLKQKKALFLKPRHPNIDTLFLKKTSVPKFLPAKNFERKTHYFFDNSLKNIYTQYICIIKLLILTKKYM